VFYFSIKWFDLKTPGREEEEANLTVKSESVSKDKEVLAANYLAALGGKDNLEQIDACITRLRLIVKDMSHIDEAKLKSLGAMGIVKLNATNLQVVLGPQAEIVAGAMKMQVRHP
jgi:PTS system N-acetylglucosamine-specific IIC component